MHCLCSRSDGARGPHRIGAALSGTDLVLTGQRRAVSPMAWADCYMGSVLVNFQQTCRKFHDQHTRLLSMGMTATAPLLSEHYGRLSNLPLRPRQVSPFTSHPSTALTLHKFRPSPDRVSRGSPLRGLGPTSSPSAPRAPQGCPALQSACGRYRRIERRGARPPGPFGPAQQVQTGRSSGADRRSLATTNRLSPTSAGNSRSTGAIEGKLFVKSCPLRRGNCESP